MSDDQIEYLNIIHGAINRMSSTSAILKGFAATVLTGTIAISYTSVNKWILLLSAIPIFSFCALDVYYLVLERKFRFLYDSVRLNKKPMDFSMQLTSEESEIKKAEADKLSCLCSPSIWMFYLPSIIIVVIVMYLKFGGVPFD